MHACKPHMARNGYYAFINPYIHTDPDTCDYVYAIYVYMSSRRGVHM